MKILGIETSCDETAAAVLDISRGRTKILSNVVSSQIKIHKKYGGVVPEVAARKHAEVIFDVLKKALSDAKIDFPLRRRGIKGDLFVNPPQPSFSKGGSRVAEIDLIAVTEGPGLVTSLRVGVLAAQAIAALAKKPLVGVNHIEAHLLSPLLRLEKTPHLTSPRLQGEEKESFPRLQGEERNLLPALGLIVSGGHTELILMKDFGKYKIIGSTRDDAVGEAFDKVAKILGLGYPGGPAISREAEKVQSSKFKVQIKSKIQSSNLKIELPRPMINSGDFDFSFAGLKTAVLYLTKKMTPAELKKNTPAIAAEFQKAAVEVLVKKTEKAAEKYKIKSILVGGGVSANRALREALLKLDYDVCLPDLEFTGDNAAMVAFAGYHKYKRTGKDEKFKVVAEPNLAIAK